MEQEQPKKRKKEATLKFDEKKVIQEAAEAKKDDLVLSFEAARYTARKGEAGDRGKLE